MTEGVYCKVVMTRGDEEVWGAFRFSRTPVVGDKILLNFKNSKFLMVVVSVILHAASPYEKQDWDEIRCEDVPK